ncbi:MAG: biotin--[acetyl-CoA-carboxylase] ligase [Defluviitaleaceae bacterium]|nr:biotin--[acetyl-CoA-carboxylase] ligase [Defluviitaleaceae bacterium]
MADILSTDLIAPFIPPGALCSRLIVLDQVDSTNTHLKRLATEGAEHGTIVVVDSQTAGRGRADRSFHSPAGRGVYFSILFRPDVELAGVTAITAFSAVAVCRAIEAACGIAPQIKWVNDLVIDDKKLCGILTESSVSNSGRYYIIGVGINVHHGPTDFPEELQGTATSLAMHTTCPIQRARLIAELIGAFSNMYQALLTNPAPYIACYKELSACIGRNIYVYQNNLRRAAHALGINDDCGLHVRYEDGTEEMLQYGETSIRKT